MNKFFLIFVLGFLLVSTGTIFAEIDFNDGTKIPAFPLAKEIWSGPQIVEINGTPLQMFCFGTDRPVAEITNFYKDNLPKAGWKLGEAFGDLNVIYFTKDNKYLYVAASGTLRGYGPSFTKYVMLLSKQELHLCAAFNFLRGPDFKEMPGRDISFIPRYPGSVRVVSIVREDKEAFFVYLVRDDAQRIAQFYRENLPTFGWKPEKRFSVPRSCVTQTFSAVAMIYNRGKKDKLSIYTTYCSESHANVVIVSYNYAFNYALWPLTVDQTW